MRLIPSAVAALFIFSAPVVSTAVLAQRGAAPPPPPAAPGQRAATGTGVILGQVIDAGTGRPVPGARVTLSGVADRAATLFSTGLMTFDTFSAMQMEMELAGGAAGVGAANAQRVIADGEGRFVFRNLARGSFPISTSMPGYIPGSAGRFRHDGPARPVELDDGERKTDVVIRMWKYASLSGFVVDEHNEPVVGVMVRAVRRTIGRQCHAPDRRADDLL